MDESEGTTTTSLDGTLRAVVAADRVALSEGVEETTLLRRRLLVFYGYFAALVALLCLLAHLAPPPSGTGPEPSALVRHVLLVHVIVLGGVVAALKLRRQASLRFLRLLDIGATLTTSAVVATTTSVMDRVLAVDLSTVAFFILFFVVRAALVPGKPWFATTLSAICSVPFTLGMLAMYRRAAPLGGDTAVIQATFAATLWFAAGVAGVYVVAKAIYGLRAVAERAVQLGQYIVHEKIGEGGMGTVYRASHAMLKRPTAIKLIAPDRAGESAIARFEREVLAASRLSHPNNVAIYDFGRTRGGVFYYAMELLEGEDLGQLVERDGPLPAMRAAHIVAQVAAALSEAHEAGLVHRDIKPDNVMLCTRGGACDFVKVLDFGLVKDVAQAGEMQLTNRRSILGTPAYMAPEAILSPEDVGPATDVYAVGCVTSFLLTGTPPFDGHNLVEICAGHIHNAPKKPSAAARHEVPPELDMLVLRCLEKKPEDRPTMRELRERLIELSHG